MNRFPVIQNEDADPKGKELLEKTQEQLGRVPNLYRTMANSSATLEAYLNFRGALSHGTLTTKIKEQLALLIAEKNNCEYCVSAHMLRGSKIGLLPQELNETRQSYSADAKIDSLLKFASVVLDKRGMICDSDYKAVMDAGWGIDEISEVIGHIALNIFSNYYNHIAQPELDFPRIEVGAYE